MEIKKKISRKILRSLRRWKIVGKIILRPIKAVNPLNQMKITMMLSRIYLKMKIRMLSEKLAARKRVLNVS